MWYSITVCVSLVLGSRYLWNIDVHYNRKERKYAFAEDGEKVVIWAIARFQGTRLVAAAQEKRTVNTYGKVILLAIQPTKKDE